MMVNSTHKKAAKAALAILVASRDCAPEYAATFVAEVAGAMSLELGDMGNIRSLNAYAESIRGRSSNRKWGDYASFNSLAHKIADEAERRGNEFFCMD
jgi:hypothetical protein